MKMNKVLLAGEGGQGIQVIAKILASAAFDSGLKVTYLPNFGVEQRGGVSLAFIQLSDEEISFPKFQKADVVVVLAPRAIKRIESYFTDDTTIIFDNGLVTEEALSDFQLPKIAIPATFFASEKLIPKVFNIVMLGALSIEIGGIKDKAQVGAIKKMFGTKYKDEPELKHFNLKAYEIGVDIMNSLKKEEKWRKKILNR